MTVGIERIKAVRRAFACVYFFLHNNLSEEDKRTLGFGTIFVEHLLCKIARWTVRLRKAGTLYEKMLMVLKAAKNDPKYPVPLHLSREDLSQYDVGE